MSVGACPASSDWSLGVWGGGGGGEHSTFHDSVLEIVRFKTDKQ